MVLVIRKNTMKSICIVDSCKSESRTRGYCSKHYHRLQRYGDAEYIPDPNERGRKISASKTGKFISKRKGPCVECGSDTTYVRKSGRPSWYKNDNGIICKNCWSKEYESKTFVPKPTSRLQGPCVECKSETTSIEKSGHAKWYKGPDGTICKNCFNRKKDRVLKPGLCVKCGIGYTKHGWHSTVEGTICQKCYRKDYRKIIRKGNCSICKTTEYAGWEIHETHGRICKSCGAKVRGKKIKEETLSHYSNGKLKCAICGYNKNINGLELDHIEGKGNESREKLNSGGGGSYYRKLKKLGFPSGYQVLCATCNKIKQIESDPKGI
jgi:hypothetical protein